MTDLGEQLDGPEQALQPPTLSCSETMWSSAMPIVQAHSGNRRLRGLDTLQTTLMLFFPKQPNARY